MPPTLPLPLKYILKRKAFVRSIGVLLMSWYCVETPKLYTEKPPPSAVQPFVFSQPFSSYWLDDVIRSSPSQSAGGAANTAAKPTLHKSAATRQSTARSLHLDNFAFMFSSCNFSARPGIFAYRRRETARRAFIPTF